MHGNRTAAALPEATAMIPLRQIEVFYAIMRAGSVTDAARVLNKTQPAVSASLKQLESRLKMQLFDRTGGRLEPTPEARALMPDVTEIFGRLSAVERFSLDLASGNRGVLSIAATPPLCDGFVAKTVAAFVKNRPGLKINLLSLASPSIFDRVISREVDLGVVYGPAISSAVKIEELGCATIACMLPARHRLARRAVLRTEDLKSERIVTYLPQALLRPYINQILEEAAQPLEISVETGTSATAIHLSMHGAGIALIESALFSAFPVPGFVLRPLEPRIRLASLLLRPRRSSVSRVANDFACALRKTFPSI